MFCRPAAATEASRVKWEKNLRYPKGTLRVRSPSQESFVSSVARTHVHSGELQFQKDVSPYFLVPESFQSRFSVSHVASAKGRSSVGLRPPPKHPASSEKKTSGTLKVLSELDHQARRMGWIYIMNSVCVIGWIQQLQTIKTFQSWKNAYV